MAMFWPPVPMAVIEFGSRGVTNGTNEKATGEGGQSMNKLQGSDWPVQPDGDGEHRWVRRLLIMLNKLAHGVFRRLSGFSPKT